MPCGAGVHTRGEPEQLSVSPSQGSVGPATIAKMKQGMSMLHSTQSTMPSHILVGCLDTSDPGRTSSGGLGRTGSACQPEGCTLYTSVACSAERGENVEVDERAVVIRLGRLMKLSVLPDQAMFCRKYRSNKLRLAVGDAERRAHGITSHLLHWGSLSVDPHDPLGSPRGKQGSAQPLHSG